MELEYLIFDFTDDESGACSFDALASALPWQLPALLAEIETVLTWANREFGAPLDAEDGGEWAFELQASDEGDAEVEIAYDFACGRVAVQPQEGRVTVALTLSGSRTFGEAFNANFPERAV